jgi:hypothetical protein
MDTWGGENVKCVTLVTMSVCCFVVFGSRSFGQDAKAKNELAERARHEFLDRNYAEADFGILIWPTSAVCFGPPSGERVL